MGKSEKKSSAWGCLSMVGAIVLLVVGLLYALSTGWKSSGILTEELEIEDVKILEVGDINLNPHYTGYGVK